MNDQPATGWFQLGAGSGPPSRPSFGATVTGPHTGPDGAATSLPTVAGYAVEGILGRGGMGVVYQARQEGLGRPVALKMLRAADAPSLDLLLRFRLEAETAAQIRHPHVVQVYEVGWHGEAPYLALEYLAGGTLAERLRAGPLAPRGAARLVADLADAVQAAHGLGIIHRDLKPANVLFDRAGTAKVADFGLARRLDGDARLTQSGQIVGTPAYMAP
jgi:serine/threonine-protein kinase